MSLSTCNHKSRHTKITRLIKYLLCKMLNSQYSTNNGCEVPVPLDVMLLVKVNSIINQYSSDSCSFKASWSNGLQPWASTIFFNSTQRYLGAIQFSNLPQTSLPWTNQSHQNESPRSHYLKFLTCSSKLQHLLFHFCKNVIKTECLKNSFGTKFKEIWWKVVSQLLIWYYPSLPYPSLEHCFEVGWHDEWNEVKMCQEVDPKMTHAF